MILQEKSVFPVLVFDHAHSWNALLDLTHGNLDQSGLDRLQLLLDGRCRSVIVEHHYIDKDYRDTFANFHAKRFNTPSSRCVRVHFFADEIQSADLDGGVGAEKDYLGYSVLRPTRPNSLGRTFLCESVRPDPDSHVCLCEEEILLMSEKFKVRGFPFISQDTDATVCAESALWMVLRYLSNRYKSHSEVFPFQITELASNHAVGSRVFPSSGLYSWQLAEALRLQGLSPMVYSRAQFPDDFDHLLYTYIESGFPLLTTVRDHVFVSIGHTSDFGGTTRSQPGVRYSSSFNRSLVVCDDNCFPYQSLWREPWMMGSNPSRYSFADIHEFIVPLPEKVFLSAENAQSVVENLLADPVTGTEANSPSLKDQDLTLRLFLTTGRSFKAKLLQRGMGHPLAARLLRQMPLPHFVWVCEMALTSEYLNDLSIRGEVLWDATRNAHEPNGWLAVHYPELLVLDTGGTLNGPQNLQFFPLPDARAYPLLQSNLHPTPTR